jgi:hypothetical protein
MPSTNLIKVEFVKNLLTGINPPPAYFPLNVLLNIKGYDPIGRSNAEDYRN